MLGWGVFPALWGEPEGQRWRLYHQHVWLGERFWVPGFGPLCLYFSGGCGACVGPWEALQRTQTRPAALCASGPSAQVWGSGRTLQGVPARHPGWENPRVLLWFPRVVLLPFFFWGALLRCSHIQDWSTIHPRLMLASGHVSGWYAAKTGACDTRKRLDLPCAEREQCWGRRWWCQKEHCGEPCVRLYCGNFCGHSDTGDESVVPSAQTTAQTHSAYHGHPLHGHEMKQHF